MANPRRRRSTIAMVPMENAKPIKCRLSTIGKAHSGPFMALAQGLVVSHSKNDAANTLTTLFLTRRLVRAVHPVAGTRNSIAHFRCGYGQALLRVLNHLGKPLPDGRGSGNS